MRNKHTHTRNYMDQEKSPTSESNLSKTGAMKRSGDDCYHASVLSSVQPFPTTDGFGLQPLSPFGGGACHGQGFVLPRGFQLFCPAGFLLPDVSLEQVTCVCFYVAYIMVLAWIRAQ